MNWIRSDATQWKQFVRNRVQEIQELTSPDKWRFCPGKENHADLVTRGVKAQELIQSDVWLHGPYWLKGNNPSFEQSIAKKAEELIKEEDDENKENTPLVTTSLEKQGLIDYHSKISSWLLNAFQPGAVNPQFSTLTMPRRLGQPITYFSERQSTQV